MSTIPKVDQVRRLVQLASGESKYEVTSVVTDRGDLPTTSLFVIAIVDGAAPKADVLARVASPLDLRQTTPDSPIYVRVAADDLIRVSGDTLARIGSVDDVTSLSRSRDDAVRRGRTLYLASAFTAFYDTLTTADAAYKQVVARLSTLTTDWRTAYAAFATVRTTIDLPATDVSVEDERIAVYRAAATARAATETTRDAAQAALDACVATGQVELAMYDALVADVAFLDEARRQVAALDASDAQDFVLKQGGYATSGASYQNLLDTKRAALATYRAQVRTRQATCAQKRADVLRAQVDVDAARTAEDTALADVRAVCPTFIP